MLTFFNLAMIAVLPVAVSVILYLLDRKTAFGKINATQKQIIYGLIFGAVAVIETECGVNVGGAEANARDASVLTAGLIFGAPAGIIAGLIGGVERFFAVNWGAGEYIRIACTISTILAGVIGAVLRKKMFDDKKPSALYALGIGLVTEVLHMLMIFFTNMADVSAAFNFVQGYSLPMVTINGLAVMVSVLAITLIGKERKREHNRQKQIATVFQQWLLLCVIVAFAITSAFTLILQGRISDNDSTNLLAVNIKDVKQDISDASDKNLLELTRKVAKKLKSESDLAAIAKEYEISEINLINDKGIITESTYPDFLGYDMASGKQSREFLVLLNGEKEFVQKYQSTSYRPELLRKYAGVALPNGGFVQVGYDAEEFQRDIDSKVIGATKNRHLGKNGCIIIINENQIIVSDRHNNEGKKLDPKAGNEVPPKNTRFETSVYGEDSYCMFDESEGYYIVAVLPVSEAVFSRNLAIYITAFLEIVVFVGLFILIYFLIKRLVVDNIRKINDSLAEITGGNLNVVVDVRENEEFASLSDDINSTVVTLKRYIAEAAARIDKELEFAKAIQHSSLPSVFPPYPNRTDFDIFASMDAAKEVGGDFYDFYFTGKKEFAFLIADVSGKGIPAAMFMMRAKTLIKSYAETGMSVDEIFTKANAKLCESNDAEMFVTAWIGKINLVTGLVTFANAGHNPPLVKHNGGGFEFVKSRPGFVLAGMEDIKYRKNELQLLPGDTIFLYTDGVTEATDLQNTLYGDDRLQSIMNRSLAENTEGLCIDVKNDVDKFVGEAPQFDDITMLCFKFKGGTEK